MDWLEMELINTVTCCTKGSASQTTPTNLDGQCREESAIQQSHQLVAGNRQDCKQNIEPLLARSNRLVVGDNPQNLDQHLFHRQSNPSPTALALLRTTDHMLRKS